MPARTTIKVPHAVTVREAADGRPPRTNKKESWESGSCQLRPANLARRPPGMPGMLPTIGFGLDNAPPPRECGPRKRPVHGEPGNARWTALPPAYNAPGDGDDPGENVRKLPHKRVAARGVYRYSALKTYFRIHTIDLDCDSYTLLDTGRATTSREETCRWIRID
jgi:hypothetical protein